jgi:hypothetical protein
MNNSGWAVNSPQKTGQSKKYPHQAAPPKKHDSSPRSRQNPSKIAIGDALKTGCRAAVICVEEAHNTHESCPTKHGSPSPPFVAKNHHLSSQSHPIIHGNAYPATGKANQSTQRGHGLYHLRHHCRYHRPVSGSSPSLELATLENCFDTNSKRRPRKRPPFCFFCGEGATRFVIERSLPESLRDSPEPRLARHPAYPARSDNG